MTERWKREMREMKLEGPTSRVRPEVETGKPQARILLQCGPAVANVEEVEGKDVKG